MMGFNDLFVPRNCHESRLRVNDSVKIRLRPVIQDTGILTGLYNNLVISGPYRKIRYAGASHDAELLVILESR